VSVSGATWSRAVWPEGNTSLKKGPSRTVPRCLSYLFWTFGL